MNARGAILPMRIAGGFILLLAIGATALGIWFYSDTATFVRSALKAPGVIVDVKPSSSHGGDSTYFHVFEFADASGVKHQITSTWSSNPPSYNVGDLVNVLYVPQQPTNARINTFLGIWLSALICAAVAATNFLFAIVLLWFIPFTIRRVWPEPVPGSGKLEWEASPPVQR